MSDEDTESDSENIFSDEENGDWEEGSDDLSETSSEGDFGDFGDFGRGSSNNVVPLSSELTNNNLPPLTMPNRNAAMPPVVSRTALVNNAPTVNVVPPLRSSLPMALASQPIANQTPLVRPQQLTSLPPIIPTVSQNIPVVNSQQVWIPKSYTLLGIIPIEGMRLRKGVTSSYKISEIVEPIVRRNFPIPKKVAWYNDVAEGFAINHSNMASNVVEKLSRCYINKLAYGCGYSKDIDAVIITDIKD